MSHGIGNRDVVVVTEVDGKPIWPNLQTIVQERLTREDLVRFVPAMGESTRVYKAGFLWEKPDGSVEWVESGRFYTTKLMGDEIPHSLGGDVSDIYTPMDDSVILDTGEAILQLTKEDAFYVSGGTLFEGQKTFASLALPTWISVGDERLRLIMTVFNDHAASGSAGIILAMRRSECNNTLTANINGAYSRYVMRHTPNISERLEEMRTALKISVDYSADFEKLLNSLVAKPLTEIAARGALMSVVAPKMDATDTKRSPRLVDRTITLWKTTDNLANHRDNAYGVYNAYVEAIDFSSIVDRGDDGMQAVHRSQHANKVILNAGTKKEDVLEALIKA